MFRYKAIENGVLSPPYTDAYRLVSAGEIVVSKVGLPKSKWLIPVEEAEKIKPLPITSAMNIYGSNQKHVLVAPKQEDTHYDNNMRVLIEHEKKQDAAQNETVIEPAETDNSGQATSEQDVL